jgi:hypothetical protein
MEFTQDLVLMITKSSMSLFVVENPWLRQIMLHFYSQIQCPFRKLIQIYSYSITKNHGGMCFLPLVNVQL